MASHQNSVAQGKTCDHNNLKLFLIHISRGVMLPLFLFFVFVFYFIYPIYNKGDILNQCISGFSIAHYNPTTSHLAVSFGGLDSLASIYRNSEKRTHMQQDCCTGLSGVL